MSKMWKGPTPLLRAAYANPVWAALHRRNGRLGVCCDTDPTTGCHAEVFVIRKGRDGEWYRQELGAVEGDTPLSTAFKASHEFTPFDAELLTLHHEYIESLAEDAVFETRQLMKRIDSAVEEYADTLAVACNEIYERT